jgi:hypothetical protein
VELLIPPWEEDTVLLERSAPTDHTMDLCSLPFEDAPSAVPETQAASAGAPDPVDTLASDALEPPVPASSDGAPDPVDTLASDPLEPPVPALSDEVADPFAGFAPDPLDVPLMDELDTFGADSLTAFMFASEPELPFSQDAKLGADAAASFVPGAKSPRPIDLKSPTAPPVRGGSSRPAPDASSRSSVQKASAPRDTPSTRNPARIAARPPQTPGSSRRPRPARFSLWAGLTGINLLFIALAGCQLLLEPAPPRFEASSRYQAYRLTGAAGRLPLLSARRFDEVLVLTASDGWFDLASEARRDLVSHLAKSLIGRESIRHVLVLDRSGRKLAIATPDVIQVAEGGR